MNPVEVCASPGHRDPRAVVLAPDLVGRSLFEPQSAAVLQLWRDRRIRPVLNRPLLLRYMKLLRQLGLDDRLLKRWAWWFNASTRTAFLDDSPVAAPLTVAELCTDLARQSEAECVIHGASIVPPHGDVAWLTADAFQEKLRRSCR